METIKTALITGAARRIGREICLSLAQKGWAVAIHYHGSDANAAETQKEAAAFGVEARLFKADLSREEKAVGLVKQVVGEMGPLGLLVNNASVFDRDDIETASLDSWNNHMQVNLRSPFVLIQGFVDQLPKGAGGNVINMLDQRVVNLPPDFTTYTLSKAGLWTLTQTLALSLAPRIRVNAIGPGPTLPSQRQSAEAFEKQYRAMPLQQPVSPADISAAIGFILDAGSMTGQLIALDSGQHLGWQTGQNAILEE